jgi:thiamine biosynthesis lipoprotein
MKKRLFLLWMAVFLFSCSPQKTWHQSALMFFNTVCELRIHCTGPEFVKAKNRVKEVFSLIESQFSPGKTASQSCHFKYLLTQSLEINKKTDGCFDITMGRLKELWGFLDGSHRVPSREEIQPLLQRGGMNQIQIKKGQFFIPKWIQLDWGGIAKGYGVDLASTILQNMGIQRGFINAGGDIYCWGTNPDRDDWKIGIQHPRKKGYLGILSAAELGAATSGDYQNFFIHNKTRFHHIFNPYTGYPARGKQSVTVMGPKVLLCDALSTAVFVSKKPGQVLEKYPDYGAVVVNDQGEVLFYGKKFNISLFE